MDFSVILAAADASWAVWTWNILKGIIGLGLVIFVHELGHFLVARFFGVKCEKFYIGFDLFGLKLAKYKPGETEYGIGIFPFGGYVKMLGQEDNPARLREELERAKAVAAGGGTPAEAAEAATGPSGEPFDIRAAEAALYDPRSYLAKSVPQRMAIISAGVIMNVIFAFLMAIVAYGIGVRDIAAVVGGVVPGTSAWREGLQTGDRITAINGRRINRFRDLQGQISLGDVDSGVKLTIDRSGAPQPIEVTAQPHRGGGLMPTIGVIPPSSTTLAPMLPVLPASSAALATPKFASGDRIVAIDGQAVATYGEIATKLAARLDQTVQVTIERGEDKQTQTLTVSVAPQAMRDVGLVMEMGPIVAVRAGSPAAVAGIKPGERIVAVDGQPVGDPMTLADRLAARTAESARITLRVAAAQGAPREVPLELDLAPAPPVAFAAESPMPVPSLGLAYEVPSRVAAILPGSPAAQAGIRAGDTITAAVIKPPKTETLSEKDLGLDPDKAPLDKLLGEFSITFAPGEATWPHFIDVLQSYVPGTKVELTVAGRSEPVEFASRLATDWYNPKRGFRFDLLTVVARAASFTEAVRLGTEETVDALTMVFRVIQKLTTRQISPKVLGGPIAIFQAAAGSASEGLGELLVFLTLLSANLAVLNFLPIPVLDGGHMVFLLYEGIRGKPPSEKVHVGLSYIGLAMLLALMVWVIGLDVGLIDR